MVKHILVACPSLRDISGKYFIVSSAEELFQSVDNRTIVDVIKETHFWHQV